MSENKGPNFGQNDTPFGSNPNPQNLHEIKNNMKIPVFPIVLLVIGLLVAFVINACIYTVAEDELAVIKVFNETKKIVVDKDNQMVDAVNKSSERYKNVEVVKDKGLFFKIPFIATVDIYSSKLITYISNKAQVTSSDGQKLEVRLFAQWEIVHPGLFETYYGNTNKANTKIDESLYADIIALINGFDRTTFLNDKDAVYAALETTREVYNDKFKNSGIHIQDLDIYRVGFTEDVYQSEYAKMTSERNVIAAGHKAEGEKLYAETISNVNVEAATIEAAAIEEAAQIKGEADATAVQIYADAFSVDPQFYEFWRMIQAYQNSIDENTTIYLDKNNDFLKFFSNVDFNTED